MAARKNSPVAELIDEEVTDPMAAVTEPLAAANDPFGFGDTDMAQETAAPTELDDVDLDTLWESHEQASIGAHLMKIDNVRVPIGPKGPYLRIRFVVTEGEEAGNEAWDNISLSPKAKFRMDPFLIALGVAKGSPLKASQLQGRELAVVVEHEEYQEKARARIAAFLPAGTDLDGDSAGLSAEFS